MIEELISKTWALEPRFHNLQASLLLKKMGLGMEFSAIKEGWKVLSKSPLLAGVDDDDQQPRNRVTTKSGDVVIISIIGTMTRYGGLCSKGTEEYASEILAAEMDDSVSGILLYLNTPGGQVDGTEMLGSVIANCKKPVVAYVAGMAASAGYWVASQCREIVMESETSSEVGSIGVLAMHVDASEHYAKEGFKYTIVRSEGSEDKALWNSLEPLSDAVLSEAKAELNVIKKAFISTVKKGRPGIDVGVFSGKMYSGKDALSLGMADRIGYMGDAIRRVDLLARKG